MSRGFIYGILCMLIVLLGVMTYLLNPPPEKPPESPKTAETTAASKEDPRQKMVKEMNEMRERMEKFAKSQKESAKAAKAGKGSAQSNKPLTQPPIQMDIRWDWYKDRPDGASGVEHVIKKREAQQKAYEEALAAAKKK
jgi:hypothetical protein